MRAPSSTLCPTTPHIGYIYYKLISQKTQGGNACFFEKPFCFFVSFAKNNGCNPKVAPAFLLFSVIIYFYSQLFLFASFPAKRNGKQPREMAQYDTHFWLFA
jgi:hypothetical protein